MKTGFWEPVFGLLILGMPIKWGFLLPKNEMPILLFLGVPVFGKKELVFGNGASVFGEAGCWFWKKPHIGEKPYKQKKP